MKKFVFPNKRRLLVEKNNNKSIIANETHILSSLDCSDYIICKLENKVSFRHREEDFAFNNATYYHRQPEWNELEIVALNYDDESCQKFIKWLYEDTITDGGRTAYAKDYKKNLVLKYFDKKDNLIENWNLYGCFITSFEYNSDDLGNTYRCKLRICFDQATLLN